VRLSTAITNSANVSSLVSWLLVIVMVVMVLAYVSLLSHKTEPVRIVALKQPLGVLDRVPMVVLVLALVVVAVVDFGHVVEVDVVNSSA
jgi:hypothetical protein